MTEEQAAAILRAKGCTVVAEYTHQTFFILYNVTGDVLQIAPSNGANCPHLVHGSLGPPDSKPQMAPRLVQLFL